MKTSAILALVSLVAASEASTLQFNQESKQFSVAPPALEGRPFLYPLHTFASF